jgi:hypothetical protein
MQYFVGKNNTSNYSLTLLCHVDSDQGIKPFEDSKEDDIVASRHESSLFSSSLSDLFSKKCEFSLQNCMLKFTVKIVG